MRQVRVSDITAAVAEMAIKANSELPGDVYAALDKGQSRETNQLAKDLLGRLKENADLARSEGLPICQDCGLAVVFVELGREVQLDGDIYQAIDEGVRQGYEKGYLRKSTCDPFSRANLGDNTPAIVHLKLVEGDKVKLILAAKGGGSENMSRVFMLPPAAGWEGIKKNVVEAALAAGPNPCPPIIIGLGVGGNFELAAMMSKEALMREVGTTNPDPDLAAKEAEIMAAMEESGLGPQALGGKTFCLAVHIVKRPCHIASLPVAMNIQCHAARHKEVTL